MNSKTDCQHGGILALIVCCRLQLPRNEAGAKFAQCALVVGTGQYGDYVTYTGEIRARHEYDLGSGCRQR